MTRLRRYPCTKHWQRGEEGVALITVTLATLALLTLAIATVGFAVGSMNISRRDQDWNAALAAAEAGIDDYIFRLNTNGNYWQYSAGNPPPDGNQAFSQWVPVPGGTNPAKFRYSTDTSQLSVDGTVKITSSGQVDDTLRTVEARVRRRSFIDYLYFTDYETLNPALYTGVPFTPAQAEVQCKHYYYAGRNPSCTNITFISQDTINGPLHSNDAIRLCGTPRFLGNTSTSWNTSPPRYRDGCPTSTPTFANPGDPRYLQPLTMPPSNSAVKSETAAGAGGCLYTGPTRLKFNSNGTFTVNSPFSINTNNGCTTNGTQSFPSNGVIYVQNVPSTPSDPNYTSGCPFTVYGRNHPLGMPITSDITTYGCRNGDVFIEGTVSGQLTIAAENNIVVTWHIDYQSGVAGSDLLGLVANTNVEIWHPVNSSTCGNTSSCNLNVNFPGETPRGSKFTNPRVSAAMLSVNHSFRNQNWARGATLGTLNVTGAIAQRYRGPVGTFSSGVIYTGYLKNYVYDNRLKYMSPPKFLDPVAAAWGVATWAEVRNPEGI